jgi:protein-tyrosine phosphatase
MLNKNKMSSQSIHYTFITPTVAIGDIYSPYNEFDIIVNLSNNSKAAIGEIYIEDVNRVNTLDMVQIIHIGLIDRADQAECCKRLLNDIIPSLLQQSDKRILFHCNSGKSRSATFAIAFLSRLFSKNAMKVLEYVASKRPIVQPNVGFMYILKNLSV